MVPVEAVQVGVAGRFGHDDALLAKPGQGLADPVLGEPGQGSVELAGSEGLIGQGENAKHVTVECRGDNCQRVLRIHWFISLLDRG